MQIAVKVSNATSNNMVVHVYDRFGGGRREVDGSPFSLAKDEMSPPFSVNADGAGNGVVDYAWEGGPSISNLSVVNGTTLEID